MFSITFQVLGYSISISLILIVAFRGLLLAIACEFHHVLPVQSIPSPESP